MDDETESVEPVETPAPTSRGGKRRADVDEVVYEPCGRLGPHEPHVWLSRKAKNCTGSGEPGHTEPFVRDADE